MATEDNGKKKPIFIRAAPEIYKQLLKAASDESVKRGREVSVPALCLEIVLAWLAARKK